FKKLYLIVENSVWLQQLTFLKPTLLEKINQEAGSQLVSDIILRVGEISSEPQEAHGQDDEDPRLTDPSPESLAQAADHAAAVKDPDLRARLIVVMAQALSLRRPSSKCPDFRDLSEHHHSTAADDTGPSAAFSARKHPGCPLPLRMQWSRFQRI